MWSNTNTSIITHHFVRKVVLCSLYVFWQFTYCGVIHEDTTELCWSILQKFKTLLFSFLVNNEKNLLRTATTYIILNIKLNRFSWQFKWWTPHSYHQMLKKLAKSSSIISTKKGFGKNLLQKVKKVKKFNCCLYLIGLMWKKALCFVDINVTEKSLIQFV